MKDNYINRIVSQSIDELGLSGIPNGIRDQLATTIATRIHDQNRPLNRNECAELLHVALPTLDRYIKEEGLPYRVKNNKSKMRKHRVFFTNEVLDWYESRPSDLRVSNWRSS